MKAEIQRRIEKLDPDLVFNQLDFDSIDVEDIFLQSLEKSLEEIYESL